MTGDVIKRTSCARVMAGGLGCYAATVGVALHGESRGHFLAALVLCGLGWNLLYTSGSALLVASVPPRDRPKAQALAETSQQVGNCCASMASGVVTAAGGWHGVTVVAAAPMLLCVAATVGCEPFSPQRSAS